METLASVAGSPSIRLDRMEGGTTMKEDELVYDIVCRLEAKLDKHIADTSSKVSRAELFLWFSLVGGSLTLALGV